MFKSTAGLALTSGSYKKEWQQSIWGKLHSFTLLPEAKLLAQWGPQFTEGPPSVPAWFAAWYHADPQWYPRSTSAPAMQNQKNRYGHSAYGVELKAVPIVLANTSPDETWYIFTVFCAVFNSLSVLSARLADILGSCKLWKQIQLPIRQPGSFMEMLVVKSHLIRPTGIKLQIQPVPPI